MWNLVIFVVLCTTCANGQHGSHRGNGWDIRLAVPGEPGNDYPTLGRIPRTTFTCSGKAPGYYADVETNCQAFRVCTAGSTYGFQSFLCPNGTLFNQAVVVCDWWMNVKCENSEQYIKSNNDQFGNLRLGPQLMNDVKKMITHPMRNPYDKSIMKSNLIVMQEYQPPSGQFFPNSLYTPAAKLVQQNFINGNSISDNVVSASTASPLYSAPSNYLQVPPQRNVEYSQKQQQNGQYNQQTNGQYFQQARLPNSQNGQYVQQTGVQSGKYVQSSQFENGQTQNGQLIQNTFRHSGQYGSNINGQHQSNNQQTYSGRIVSHSQSGTIHSQQHNTPYSNGASQQPQSSFYNQGNVQKSQQQVFNNNAGYQRGPLRQNEQYTDNTINPQSNAGKQTEFGISFNRQQYNTNKDNNAYKTTIPQFSSEISGKAGTEAKQNLVSESYVPSTVITKTLTFNRIIQEPKPGAPKSRITFKTWIVKQPAKTAKLIQAEPTPYTYNRPTYPSSTAKLIVEPTPYSYNKPTTIVAQTQKIISEPEPYYYNPPTVTTQTGKLISEPDGYSYSRPTIAAKQIRSTVAPTLPSRLYLTPSPSPTPTIASRLYLAPTTFKPIARLYLPASASPVELSRQYLGPNEITQSDNLQSAKLQASPTTPTPVVIPPNDEKPKFSVVKKSRFNALRNNLTFADILTKEKLDITVNDIVKDTRNILGTAEPVQQFGQQREEEKEVDYPVDNYLISESESFTESGENLTPLNAAPTREVLKSSRLVQPAADLLPPLASHENDVQTNNRLASLPFFTEPPLPTNTIERTVSLKISLPEKTAQYLFKTSNDSDFDKLEILNTGSSNYLVLTNNLAKNPTVPSFIPIGKLIVDKDSNLSDSQALVFSFLADSINQAKDIAKQNALTSISQLQDIDNEEFTKITNNVAQLTSSQYASNNNNNNAANIFSVSHRTNSNNNNNNNNQLRTAAKYTNNVTQNQVQKQTNIASTAHSTNANNNLHLKTKEVSQNQSHQKANAISTAHKINSNNNDQLRNSAKNTNGVLQNQERHQQTNIQQNTQAGRFYSTQFQSGLNSINANLQINNDQNQLYSGQLYQVPVPDVTSLYNGQSSAKLISQNNIRKLNTEAAVLHQNTNTDHNNNFAEQSNGGVEIIHSQTLPLHTSAKLQNAPEESLSLDSQENQSYLGNFLNPENGIAAQLRDKIVGTIQHPLEENKLVTYEKDQSYYLYTKFDNFDNEQPVNNGQKNAPQSAKLTQSGNADNNVVNFQFIPSVSYQVEDEKDQQSLLNTLQIDEFGYPKVTPGTSNQGVLTSDIDYTIQHSTPAHNQYNQLNSPNTLYAGPSSYSAPQASVGRLENIQRGTLKKTSNAAKLELEDNSQNGYSKVTPNRQFTY